MPRYKVTVTRTESYTKDYEVETSCPAEAEAKAYDLAADDLFPRGEADYKADVVVDLDGSNDAAIETIRLVPAPELGEGVRKEAAKYSTGEYVEVGDTVCKDDVVGNWTVLEIDGDTIFVGSEDNDEEEWREEYFLAQDLELAARNK